MVDVLVRLLNKPTGSTLGFIGIAITYIASGIFADAPRKRDYIGKIAFWFAGIVFFYIAYLCQKRGTATTVDAGEVLAYLGIGTGLICTAWAAWVTNSHRGIAWLIFIIGMGFELIGLLLIHHAGLI